MTVEITYSGTNKRGHSEEFTRTGRNRVAAIAKCEKYAKKIGLIDCYIFSEKKICRDLNTSEDSYTIAC